MAAPDISSQTSVAHPVQPACRREGTLYLLGIDGMSPDLVRPMSENGELPNLSRLADEGAHGMLSTVTPTNSALLWTSIATGRHYADHGIDGFDYYSLLGRHISRSAVRRMKRLFLRHIIKALMRLGLMQGRLLDGRHIRAKTLWGLVSEAGGRVGVVNWWHTWPAEPVNGFIVSDRLHYWRAAARGREEQKTTNLTYPDSLLDELRPLIVPPDQVDHDRIRQFVNLGDEEFDEFVNRAYVHHSVDGELRFLISGDLTAWRTFRHCHAQWPELDLAALYLRAPDVAQHCAFQYMPTSRDVEVPQQDRRRFGNVVPLAYRMADDMVGGVLELMDEEDSLLVMSDHGFGYQPGRREYGHARGEPPGVIYAYGKEFEAGAVVEQASVYDVFPTAMRILGYPPSRELEGRCLEEALTDDFQRKHPPLQPVQTYGARLPRHDLETASSDVDEEVMEHLRALGYLE